MDSANDEGRPEGNAQRPAPTSLIVIVTLENTNVLQKSVCAHQGCTNDDSHRGEANGERKRNSMTGFHLKTPFYIFTRKYFRVHYYKKHAMRHGVRALLRRVLRVNSLRGAVECSRVTLSMGFIVHGKAVGMLPSSKSFIINCLHLQSGKCMGARDLLQI